MSVEVYSVREAARLLGLHPETVRRYLREGQIQGLRFGRHWRVSAEGLQTFLRSREAAEGRGAAEGAGRPGVPAMHVGYVRGDNGWFAVQLPADNAHGFIIASARGQWPGGVGAPFESWLPVDASKVPRSHLDRLRAVRKAFEGER